ncbi:MAG: Epoxide hydrolase [Marmoricola sp.]|nr:Epoxide hydrolase [Marmoricola sp.]
MTTQWREASAGGQTFRYADSGAGPLVLLLHGFPDLPTGWDSLRARLNAAGYRTVAPFLRGYHPATFTDRAFASTDLADDVALLLDALDEPTAVVVGHDWGADAAYCSATKYPGRVTKMVALGIPHPSTLKPSLGSAWTGRHFVYFKLPWAATTARLFGLRMVDRLYRRWAPSWDGPARDASVDAAVTALSDPLVLRGSLAYYKALQPGNPFYQARIDVPGLVIGGADEPPVLQHGYEATPGRFNASCEVHVLDGAGHWPHREQENAFLEVLLAFLDT